MTMKLRTEEFYQFMRKREQIRLNRLAKEPWPWTDDQILRDYSFTNVKREHDRTSIMYREKLFEPNKDAPFNQVLINAATARFFGRAEFVTGFVGWQESFDADWLCSIARGAKDDGVKIWTSAYMITAGGQTGAKEEIVVRQYLAHLWANMEMLERAFRKRYSWKDLSDSMRKCDGFGGTGFMSKEILLDTMFTNIWPALDIHGGQHVPSDWSTWCPAGPGARRGVARVTGQSSDARIPERLALEVILELYGERFEFWPHIVTFQGQPIANIDLDLHDIQFQLCEFDKYERARLGEGRPKNLYHRK